MKTNCEACLWFSDKCKHPRPIIENDRCLGFDMSDCVTELMRPDDYAEGIYKGYKGVWRQKAYMHK